MRLRPIGDRLDERPRHAPAAYLVRGEQVLQVADIVGRGVSVDQEVRDADQASIEPGTQRVHARVLGEFVPGAVVHRLRQRPLVEIHVAAEQHFPLRAVGRFELSDGDHQAEPYTLLPPIGTAIAIPRATMGASAWIQRLECFEHLIRHRGIEYCHLLICMRLFEKKQASCAHPEFQKLPTREAYQSTSDRPTVSGHGNTGAWPWPYRLLHHRSAHQDR